MSFAVVGPGRQRLEARAQALGFVDLAGLVADRYVDKEHSLRRIAADLGTTHDVVAGLRDDLGIGSHRGVRARARSRRAGNEQRVLARVVELGFPDVRRYLLDRSSTKAWTIPKVATELGIGAKVVRLLLGQAGVVRRRATASTVAAARRGRARQSALAVERRRARLGELGFDDLVGYLTDRVVGNGWSLKRARAELRGEWAVAPCRGRPARHHSSDLAVSAARQGSARQGLSSFHHEPINSPSIHGHHLPGLAPWASGLSQV